MKHAQSAAGRRLVPGFLRVFMALSIAAGGAGCAALNPEALQPSEVIATVQDDSKKLAAEIEPLRGPLTLEEAIARALKYNSERQLKALEEAVAYGTFDAQRHDMLPKLVADAGYHYRNKDLVTRSQDSVTGQPSLANPYISSERDYKTAELGFSWSLLDFGQSYLAARQNADRFLIAAERRRKATHNLIQEVRTSYWRVVAAQVLNERLSKTIREAEAALGKARQVESERLRTPLEPLRYQRQLLENLRMLELIQQELASARVELAALISLPIGQEFQVVEPQGALNPVWLERPVERLEEHALLRNPDLRESIYNARIARQETRRAMLKLFPGLSFNYAIKHNDDSFLINKHWNEAGVQLSFNLLGLVSLPAQMRLAEAGENLADRKRMATQMAVLAQLHLARLQYAHATRLYERSEQIAQVDKRIADHVANQEQAAKQNRQELVAQQTAAILSVLRRYQALSNAHAAASRLQATLGLEPHIDGGEGQSLAQLTGAVAGSLRVWESGQLPALPQTPGVTQ